MTPSPPAVVSVRGTSVRELQPRQPAEADDSRKKKVMSKLVDCLMYLGQVPVAIGLAIMDWLGDDW